MNDSEQIYFDALYQEHLTDYFADLSRSHSWSTVKPAVVHSLADILTCEEIARMIASTREHRYRQRADASPCAAQQEQS